MRRPRLLTVILSNALLPLSVLIFASGFFPYKPFLAGLATWPDTDEPTVQAKRPYNSGGGGSGREVLEEKMAEAPFERVVFMVVDALRSDFVFGAESGMGFVQSLIRDGAAIPFTAHATPPTVTMPRVKALTTGSVPSFLDLILNFAESDTSSSLALQDTWLAQLRRKGQLVFYGDDTWLKLFPDIAPTQAKGQAHVTGVDIERDRFWLRHEGTSSFFVSDFTEVDNNVTRHLPSELARDDWNAMILHYLGLDHIGHKTGPQGPNMLPKQREMDDIVRTIYEAMETEAHHSKTLLVLLGDHGMNAGGNHGGSGPGETDPAMVFAAPRFKGMPKRRRYECPALPREGTEFHFYTKIGQSDVVPTLAALLGLPVSKNSLGVVVREMAGLWGDGEWLGLLRRNARQLLGVVRAKVGAEGFDRRVEGFVEVLDKYESGGIYDEVDVDIEAVTVPEGDEVALLAWSWAVLVRDPRHVVGLEGEEWVRAREGEYYRFLEMAQGMMSDTASSYDLTRMVTGMGLAGTALMMAVGSLPPLWPPSTAGSTFTLVTGLYGAMMFASSYVEEEQHFWYWLTPAWIVVLAATKLRSLHASNDSDSRNGTTRVLPIALATFILLTTHRLATRWNQTGQKHAGAPDIVHSFFPAHHQLLWLLILSTYVLNGYLLHQRTFAGLFMTELRAFFTSSMVVLGVIFKLNFTQEDSPELVQGLGEGLRRWTKEVGLVGWARGVFGSLGLATAAVVVLEMLGRGKDAVERRKISLAERLHHLLTLFLMTQTRAPNVPLFALLEAQRVALGVLLSSTSDNNDHRAAVAVSSRAMQTATSALLLSHTYFFCTGGSNSISSIDLSNAYNGVADYNIAAVGVLLFASNWAGPLWWCSAAVLLVRGQGAFGSSSHVQGSGTWHGSRDWVKAEREKLKESAATSTKTAVNGCARLPSDPDAWRTYLSAMTSFVAASLVAVMAACTMLRTHLFIWTVFSPKYLYAMAWAVGWHLLVNVGLGSLLWKTAGR